MKKTYLLIILIPFLSLVSYSQPIPTRFEQSGGRQTPPYHEIIDWWMKLDQRSGKVKLLTMGMTDANLPLHLAVIANNGDYNFKNIRKNNKRVILVINGIHPGEPDGIDASMLLARDIVINKQKLPDNVVLAIIPVYNIGGCLNRSPFYRIDQNGPEEKGFRGNSQNLDLNRDFIKNDSKDARAFTEIFHLADPDVLIDNHVSNGADYQHIMTLVTSQHNKLGGVMGEFMNQHFEPGLFSMMKDKGYDLVPYVNVFGSTPDSGWSQFWDSPRYSSGFASLWHSFAFVAETHMLKPYSERVRSTYTLMQSLIDFTAIYSETIKNLRARQKLASRTAQEFVIRWKHDRSRSVNITYKGYAAVRKPSDVSGLPRLYYDRSKPFERQVPFYNFYKPDMTIVKPKAYIIPQGWWKVIDLLKLNKIEMTPLKKDTAIEVEAYRIQDYKSNPRQFEMHHLNTDVVAVAGMQVVKFRKGDMYIPLDQAANRFLVETLEPMAEDSYFAWNFFDAILGQKEGFSGYSFEDIAAEYLATHPELKTKLEQRKATDSTFAKSGGAQLNFVYQNSPFFEPSHLRYPVYRVLR
jgi:hypothetical protein